MNKISKKIVALATMAAFVLTLVPAAAFGASAPEADASYYGTVDENVEASTYEEVVTEFELGNFYNDVEGSLDNVMVWATDEYGNISSAAKFFKQESGEGDFTKELREASTQANSYAVDEAVTDGFKVAVQFANPGKYTLHAAQVDTSSSDKKLINFKSDDAYKTVNVTAGDVSKITVDGKELTNNKYEVTDDIFANGTQTKTLTIKAFSGDEDSYVAAAGKSFTVSAKNGLNIAETNPVADRNGEFELTYSADKAGTYYITVKSEDGYTAQIVVEAYDRSTSYPAEITTSVDNEATLNVDDVNNATTKTLEDAVQFTIEDQNGKTLTANAGLAGQPAADQTVAGANKADYVKLTGYPKNFKGKGTDFSLVWDPDENVYTLQYKGTAKLLAGEYTVRVSLYETGDYADATFTLGEFDDNAVVDMKIVPSTDRVAYNVGEFTYKVILVDENGVQKNVTGQDGEYYMGIDSSDVAAAKFDTVNGTSGVTFNDKVTAENKEDIVGSVITLTAVSDKYGFIKTSEITITDQDVVEGLAFDTTTGAAGEDNIVKVSVVDADGNVVKGANGQVKVYVADQSNENANVDITAGDAVVNGKNGTLTVFSDEETTLDIVVAVVNTTTNKVYADTLTYTVGAEDVNADKLVAMTINSTDYIVDNEIVAGDAAPYIDSAWRTMVPIRVLAETLGGTVDFKDNVITIVDGDTTIVMTVGETAYTVNDEEANMDTAPVIGEGDRTFVPVRFVAEALGYTVTPLQDANGLTASVVFQK